MGFLGLLTDDWKKIPQNLRYVIIAGISLIFNSWLLDHWGSDGVYKYLGMDIRGSGYNLGLSLIFFGFALLIGKQFFYLGRLIYLRKKYPESDIEHGYYLIWFKGKLILFNTKEKKYYHVYPWDTAQDLLFVGKGQSMNENFDPINRPKIPVNNQIFDLTGYKNGGSINTRS